MTIAITGASGNIGGRAAALLAAEGHELRLVVRSLDRAPQLPGATAVASTYTDARAAAAALEGVSTLFMVSAGESADRVAEHTQFIAAAAAAGTQHIVYTSFVGAAPDCTFTLGRDHYATEQAIFASGMSYTILRDNFYADIFPYFVNEEGVIAGPAGVGRVAAVARADVSHVAAKVLASPEAHVNVTYDLTGPEALTLAEVAEIIGETSGRSVSYFDEPLDAAYASRGLLTDEQWQVEAWVSTYTAIAAGDLAEVRPDVAILLGRPALTVRQALS